MNNTLNEVDTRSDIIEGEWVEIGNNLPAIFIEYPQAIPQSDWLTKQETALLHYILLEIAQATVEDVRVLARFGNVVVCEFFPREIRNPHIGDPDNRLDPVLSIPLQSDLPQAFISGLRQMMRLQQNWVSWGGLSQQYAQNAARVSRRLLAMVSGPPDKRVVQLSRMETEFFTYYLHDITSQPHNYLPDDQSTVLTTRDWNISFALGVLGVAIILGLLLLVMN